MIRIAAALVLATGCTGDCETVDQQGPGVTGTMRYATPDGTTTAAVATSRLQMTARDAFEIRHTFVDTWGATRDFRLALTALVPGATATDLADHGELCMVRQSQSGPVCAPLTGTIVVRRLAADCYEHESGIGTCAETIDATLHAASSWQDTQFSFDGDALTVGRWVPTACDD